MIWWEEWQWWHGCSLCSAGVFLHIWLLPPPLPHHLPLLHYDPTASHSGSHMMMMIIIIITDIKQIHDHDQWSWSWSLTMTMTMILFLLISSWFWKAFSKDRASTSSQEALANKKRAVGNKSDFKKKISVGNESNFRMGKNHAIQINHFLHFSYHHSNQLYPFGLCNWKLVLTYQITN